MQYLLNVYVIECLDVHHSFSAQQVRAYNEPTERSTLLVGPCAISGAVERRIVRACCACILCVDFGVRGFCAWIVCVD